MLSRPARGETQKHVVSHLQGRKKPSAPPAYYYTTTLLCLVIVQICYVYPAQI